MSRSAIYVTNTTAQTLVANSTINPGVVQRRFGCNLNLSGNAISLQGSGYYKLNSSISLAPTAASTPITISLYKDNVLVPGAIATTSVTTAGNVTNVNIVALIRENCCCGDSMSNLTFVISGAATVSNIATVVEKL